MKDLIKKNKVLIVAVIMLGLGLLLGKFIYKPTHPVSEHTTENATESKTDEVQIWTCSMHPQIRMEEFGLCPICEMDLTPLDDQQDSGAPGSLQMTENAIRLAQIETEVVGDNERRTIDKETIVEGTIELDERLINTQTAHVGGRIEKIFVSFTGEYVKAGQLIATLYSPELVTASKELLTAVKYENTVAGVRDAAINKLKNWKLTDDQIQNIIDSDQVMETVNIYADYSGIILDKKVTGGDHVMEGGVLYTIVGMHKLWAVFNVFESDLSGISLGQKVTFNTPGVPDETFEARISYIDPVLDQKTASVPVRAEIANYNNILKPGMLIKGNITAAAKGNVTSSITVPKSAVLWTGQRSVVYIQNPDTEIPSFEYREVVLGELTGDRYIISEGLEAGEKVVTHGAFVIDATAQLNNQQSMINKDVTVKEEKVEMHPDFSNDVSIEFKQGLEKLTEYYLSLKDIFVQSDDVQVKTTAVEMMAMLPTLKENIPEGEAGIYWSKQFDILDKNGNELANAQDIEAQRSAFSPFSEALIRSVKAFGSDNTYYVQYCPMAFDNQGAEWLSKEDYIRNPYFGDKMLKCGSILDTLKMVAE